jgi:hypothetical protein
LAPLTCASLRWNDPAMVEPEKQGRLEMHAGLIALSCCLIGGGVGGYMWFEELLRSPLSVANGVGALLIAACFSIAVLVLDYRTAMDGVRTDEKDDVRNIAPRRRPLIYSTFTKLAVVMGVLGGALIVTALSARPPLPRPVHFVTGSGTVLEGVIRNLPSGGKCGALNLQYFFNGSPKALESLFWQETEPSKPLLGAAFMSKRLIPPSEAWEPLYETHRLVEVYLGSDPVVVIVNAQNDLVKGKAKSDIVGISTAQLSAILTASDQAQLQWSMLGGAPGKRIQLMLPHGCPHASATCNQLAKTAKLTSPFTRLVSHELHSPHISTIVESVRNTPDALGVVPQMFVQRNPDGVVMLPVDGSSVLFSRGLWAYFPVEDRAGLRLVDAELLACILDDRSADAVNKALNTTTTLDREALKVQLRWLTEEPIQRTRYHEVSLSASGGSIYMLSEQNSESNALIKRAQE